MGVRRTRLDLRIADQKTSRIENGHRKRDERARRERRMRELIGKSSTFPYTPPIMSWLSTQLDKPSTQITKDDVDRLMKSGQ